MSIPPDFVDELRDRLSIASVVGGRVRLQKRGRDHLGLCPFHKEKTPSFTVSEEKGFFHCFGCGAHGDVVGFVMRSDNLSFPEAVERLAREVGMQVPATSPEERQREERRATLHSALEAAAAWFEAQLRGGAGRAGLDYFKRRGLQDDTIARFRLGYAPDARTALKDALGKAGISEALMLEAGLVIRPEDGRPAYDRFRGRVMFPITDRRGRVIAFGGRILDQGEPKYLNSPETPLFHKGRTLYGLAQAARGARAGGEVVVCEGYMDVIALAEAGFAGAVAPLGTALTEGQIAELWRLAPEPVLCFDGDAAGQRAAARAVERALPLLQPGKSLRFALLPPGDDPDSLVRARGPAAMGELLQAARPLIDMLWEQELALRPTDTPERRAGFRQRMRDRIRLIGERSVYEDYRHEVDRRLAAAFDPPSPRLRQTGPFRGRRGAGSPPAALAEVGGMAARHGTGGLDRRPDELLVALLVNHPHLVAQRAEEAADITLRAGRLDKLRSAIIDLAAAHPGLDSDGFKRHLTQMGFAEELQGLLTRTKHIKCTLAGASAEEATAGLQDVLRAMRKRELRQERDAAAARLGEDSTEEDYARYAAVRQVCLEDESGGEDDDAVAPRPGRVRTT
ncbi:MAG: DNA primase [Dongiaceae bacterium]